MSETTATADPNASESDRVALEDGLSGIYRALAGLYLEPPTAAQVDALRAWCGAIGGETELPPAFSDAIDTVLQAKAEPETLTPAFTRTFLGIDERRSPPPPYESLYVDGVLNGPSSTEVEAFYFDSGCKLAVDDELIDHAGYELDFLAELCARGDRRRQLAFVDTHIGDWLSEFHDEARKTELPAFYRGVFALTDALFDLHTAALEEADVRIDHE